ncbi:hypothetical protein P8C59_008505 [Phyllachora maydis]|uniref:Uncharacterized protein n=1 Tax=Phyllachora maydis TaxID=1825666 RepID=A0AAD9IAK4_9PEZI|nr:hypothetical protein P8C59_008505 [Phyllachora maydis]
MDSGLAAFYALWRDPSVRERLFQLLSHHDLGRVRLANSACCNLVTKRLFLRLRLTFTATSFTRPSRIQALSRVGHHVEHLTFCCPHSDATFLPPLIHPVTGRELCFLYAPYAGSDLADVLTQQYPPLFHAATNVPSFIGALRQVPNLRHLTIRTPGQDAKERYRRGIVDYALISLRIAVERSPLPKLHKLSLSAVHPAALLYLRHMGGFGALPSAARRWGQIRKLSIAVDSWDFHGPSPGLDLLKIIDDFARSFAPGLEKLDFSWLGQRGPCPLTLAADPLFQPPRSGRKLFKEVTGPMSPLPPRPARPPPVLPRLRFMRISNAAMKAPQVSRLVRHHKQTVREFDFEDVALVDGGTWEGALAPLGDGNARGSSCWSCCSTFVATSEPSLGSQSPASTLPVSDPGDEVPMASAAAAAAREELLNVHVDVAGPPQRSQEADLARSPPPVGRATSKPQEDLGLASDIEAAKQASLGFSTRIKKRRVRKRKSQRPPDDRGSADDHDGHGQQSPHPTQVLHHVKELHPRARSPGRRPSPRTSPPTPVLLQATTYKPPAKAACLLPSPMARGHHEDGFHDALFAPRPSVHAQLWADAAAADDYDDDDARSSALQRARDAVMGKLSREFRKRNHHGTESAAVTMLGLRLREGLFGRNLSPLAAPASERQRIESRSALVPLLFSR